MITKRWPLIDFDTDEIDSALADLITDAQWRWLAVKSIHTKQSVDAMLRRMRPMVEDTGDGHTIRLEGRLPGSELYGCIDADGTTHT